MIKMLPHWIGLPEEKVKHVDPTRRAMLKAVAAAPIAAAASASAKSTDRKPVRVSSMAGQETTGAPVTMEFLHFDDEIERFRQTMRVTRSIEDNDDILFWYHHISFVVPLNQRPAPVARFEGIEFTRHERVDEHTYLHHGHNLSYPRDLATGKFSDTAINPVTGNRVRVPGFLPETLGPTHLLTPKGVYWTGDPSPDPMTGYYMFHRDGSHVVMDWLREPPHYAPQNFMETSYARATASDFLDHGITKLMTVTNGSYVLPYPEWLEMGDRPGHMLITWSGFKLNSIAELPIEFRERVEQEMPNRLKINREAFEEWNRT